MARYIDAETALEDIRNLAEKHHMNGEYEFANGILKAITRIKSQPTADVKEVIYCKNCNLLNDKYAKQGETDGEGNPQYYCKHTGKSISLDDYCSYADMREE